MVTGSRIVSPLAMVQKSNIPALSRKVLSLVRCLVLRKFVGSVLKQVSPSQKCFILRVGRGGVAQTWCCLLCRTWVLGPSCHIPNIYRRQMGGRRSFGRRFRFLLANFHLPQSNVVDERSCPKVLWGILGRLNEGENVRQGLQSVFHPLSGQLQRVGSKIFCTLLDP